MQFGRLTGAGIAVLGALLLLLQFIFFMSPAHLRTRPTEEHRDLSGQERAVVRMHRVPMLPGILGAVLVIGGLAVFFLAGMEDEPPSEKAVK